MNLILSLKELWHRRALVAAALVAAALISLLAVFDVGLAPPSVSKRVHPSARGSIEILVDSARSPIADARRDLTGLTARAGVFARYIGGGNVVNRIAKANEIPAKQIDVAGPESFSAVPGVSAEALQLHPYGISITQSSELPIIAVLTRAPTVAEARGLAAAAPGAIRSVVHSIQRQQGTPEQKRVEFRVLGPAKAAPDDDALGKKAAAVLFVVLLTIFLLAILAVPRLVAAWRAADHPGQPVSPVSSDERSHEVLLLPAGPNGDAGEGDPAELDRAAGES